MLGIPWRALTVGACLLVSGISPALAQDAGIPTKDTVLPDGVERQPAMASQCMACHGPAGISGFSQWPNLAGQKADYLEAQLQAFKSGERTNDMMQIVTSDLGDDDIQTLSRYFSKQSPAWSKDLLSAADSAPKTASQCTACHGDKGVSDNTDWPDLAAQKKPYLIEQLKAYRSGKRENAIMNPIAEKLSDKDIQDLAEYYGKLGLPGQ